MKELTVYSGAFDTARICFATVTGSSSFEPSSTM